ncbi:hypothetical protein ABPG74_017799, partial [Tetrahymena malaccensis]
MNKCLPCSQNCSDCFNTGYDSCMSCASNFLVSYQNTSTCVSNCQQGENQTKNESCIKCLVEGCTKCDSNQICLECNANLKLDLLNNKCIIQQGVCDSSLDFIYSPFTQNECVQSCPSSYYQNQKTQICQQINKCAQIDKSSETLSQKVTQIESFMQKNYILRAFGCNFIVVNQNFEIIDSQILQNITQSDSQYSFQGQEYYQRSFIFGKYGGCTANYTLTVMNFETKQIIFQKSNLDQDYSVFDTDNINQIVFLSNLASGIALYDVLNQKLTQYTLGQNSICHMFQFQRNNNTSYYFQINQSVFMVAKLSNDRSLTFLNETLNFPSQLQYVQKVFQNREYIVGIFYDYLGYTNSIYKLIQVNQTYFQTILIEALQMSQYQIYYSNVLNSIIQYDTYGYSLQVLALSEQSDQIDYQFKLSLQTLNSFQIFQNQEFNSTFAFFISDRLQFVNLTDYQIKFKNKQINLTNILPKTIDTPFITRESTITNVIFQSNQIIEIFLAQIIKFETQTYQQVRIQINLSEFQFQIKYLDPNQNQKLYYIQNSNYIGQYQNMFTTKNQFDIDSFYIYDAKQVFLQQALGVQKIKFNLQNLQKNPRINTRLINLKMQDNLSFYDDIKFINNQNLLIIQNIPQIFSLDTCLQLIQNPQDYNFSLQNFIILNDDQIAYLSVNELNESILYLVDFQYLKISQIFNFGVQLQLTFYTTDNSITPLIAFNDLIYFCFGVTYSTISTYTDCQPFSMSQNELVYNLTRMQFYALSSRSLIYQKTGDIYIFSENVVNIYSFDLSTYQIITLNLYYPTINYSPLALTQKDQYVFYFDQNYFVRFDMDLKSISQVKAQTDADLYDDQLIDFYQLDENLNYIKKSQSIVDSNNMVVIKSQMDNINYIGKLLIDDDSQINCFQSEIGVFWYLNLFNNPFNVFNFTQYQLMNQLQNNKILFYDKINNIIIFYDITRNNEQQLFVSIDFSFDLQITVVDYERLSYIWIQNQVKINLRTTNQENEMKFYTNCEENLVVIYYPYIYIFDFKTGNNPDEFKTVQPYLQIFYNFIQAIPLVSRQNSIFQSGKYLLNYQVNNTNLYYDVQNKILIGVTGSLKQINIINIPGQQQLSTYETINQFSKSTVYYSQVKNSLIIVDSTPILYFCDYLSQNITNFNIELNEIKGILMDENKNIVFLYSNQFILTYNFPSMQFIETISLQKYNYTYIQRVFLNTQLSIMTVQTLTHIISFDLTEMLYASETNLLQYQKIQSLVLNQQYLVLYSTVNLSINLYLNTQLIDTFLIESFQQNIYPYLQQIILMKDNQFIFISYQTLNIIKADLQQNKLILLKKLKLNQMPDNYFYDKIQDKIFILYEQNYQLSSFDINIENIQEINLFNFKQGDIQQSIILSNYLIIPSTNFIQIYDLILNQSSQISFTVDSNIKFIFKLQSKNYQDYSTYWWDIPFDFEERYNNNDAQDENEKLLCLVLQTKNNFNLQILNMDNKQIIYIYQLNYCKIMNIISDPFRKIIYLINDQGQTLIFTYKLELVITLQNACLKQAKISYDQDFIYSICPNDVIIFNGLSFQQQFPIINKGLSEVHNFVNTKYNNYFLALQKNKFSVFKLEQKGNYEVIYEINEAYQFLLNIYSAGDCIQSINQDQISDKNIDQTYQITLVSTSNTQKDKICWDSDFNFPEYIQNFYLKDMNLQIQSSINLNQNKQMKYFQMQNVTLNLKNSLTLSGFDQVLFQNITFTYQDIEQSQIIITNCKQIVIKQIEIVNLKAQYSIFNITNSTKVILEQVIISNMKQSTIFTLNNNQQLNIVGFDILESVDIKVTVKDVNLQSLTYQSIVTIDNCNQVQVIKSEFENNKNSNGFAGAIYLTDNSVIQIQDTIFLQNQCLSLNGGALSFTNNVFPGNITIQNCIFNSNQALLSTGGAINLINSNLVLQNSTIISNQALIGGGIYYQQIVPDFVLDLKQGLLNSNIISQNFAFLYGKNIGSTLRSIYINLNDIVTIDVQAIISQLSVSIIWDQQNQQIQCTGELQSKQFVENGFNLNIQVMYKPQSNLALQIVSNSFSQLQDSKGKKYIQQGQLYKNITLYFGDCQLGQIIKKQGNSIFCENCSEGKYSLQLSDSQCSICPDSAVKCFQSTIILKDGYWRENNKTDQILYCSQNPEACQPELKQSINYCVEGYQGPLCLTCDTYGEIWGKRFSQSFNTQKCYNCEENILIMIIQNLLLFLLIFYYIFAILKSIIAKLQAKLAGHFISRLDMIYLGSTLIQSDKPQIMSKILTDHIQILSLLSFFNFNIPNYFNIPIQLFGNSLNVTSKSIDCVFSNYPSLKPLWFYQSLWSMALPISILLVYSVFGFFYKLLKNSNIILRYLDTACIFIYLYFFPMVVTILSRSLNCIKIGEKSYLDLDVNIRCLDPTYHIPFIIYFSIPLLSSRFIFQNLKDKKNQFKKIDPLQNVRNNWSYYTRNFKASFSSKQNSVYDENFGTTAS